MSETDNQKEARIKKLLGNLGEKYCRITVIQDTAGTEEVENLK